MKFIYPAFERGRIMKTELLEALRDYSYASLKLTYRAYSDGIIKGCGLTTDERYITIGEGIIKCEDFIFLITEPMRVVYEPTEKDTSLKFRVISKEKLADYIRYEAEFVLDHVLTRESNEIEICRFKLKKGFRLRYEYKDFYDIQTEFDTLNLGDATWAGIGEPALSKAVTDCFAKEVLKCESAGWEDVQIAYTCLQRDDTVPLKLINHYIQIKTGGSGRIEKTQTDLFEKLGRILEDIRKGKKSMDKGEKKSGKTIIME